MFFLKKKPGMRLNSAPPGHIAYGGQSKQLALFSLEREYLPFGHRMQLSRELFL